MTDRLSQPDRPMVILDRDGVINLDSDGHIKSPEEWEPIVGSLEAIGRLNHEGWRVFVVTNQSGLARGLFHLSQLHSIHQKMRERLAETGGQIEAVFFCPHGPDAGCGCRKPAPGLLQDVAARVGHGLEDVPLIGDSHRDLAAAAAVGARPMLVLTGKGQLTLEGHTRGTRPLPAGTQVFRDLCHAADHLLQQSPPLPGP
ncbi:MAG: D-glycero-beta-D-manno-heptose 1,7-bisphosphate 7-phosphatase [Burkholderiaceae bacterium]|nr:D-glycero-beta-D-manno-heptose 1,7-bisphosphate 7-phosphatase [Burkholderiaceae bacterium]